MNQEILHFRNQPVKEVAREAFSLVYQLLRFEVFGQDNLEFMRRGIPAIVGFFPHTSHADGPAVRKAFPRDLRKRLIYPAAADYWYEGSRGKIRSALTSLIVRSFPLGRDGSGRVAMMVGLDIAEDYLRRGYSIAVSPEGTRTLLPLEERVIHSGPAELALRTGFPVVPVKLDGFGEVLPKGMNFPQPLDGLQRKPVSVRIGEAMVFDVENMSVGSRSQQRGLITAALRERLLEM